MASFSARSETSLDEMFNGELAGAAALAGRAEGVHGKEERDELANAVAWLAVLLDELADAEAPNRWAACREKIAARCRVSPPPSA